ncbi:hypothetical protein WCLP8_3800016 [uncultured Gammaproteobacteria bacterium]
MVRQGVGMLIQGLSMLSQGFCMLIQDPRMLIQGLSMLSQDLRVLIQGLSMLIQDLRVLIQGFGMACLPAAELRRILALALVDGVQLVHDKRQRFRRGIGGGELTDDTHRFILYA